MPVQSVPRAVATGCSGFTPSLPLRVLTSFRPSPIAGIVESITFRRDNQDEPLTSRSSKTDSQRRSDMLVNWIKDADAALEQAKAEEKPLLIDFSAAPA